jgi:hypothetical protein
MARRAVRSFVTALFSTFCPCLSSDTNEDPALLHSQTTSSHLYEDLGIYQLLNVVAKFILFRGAGNGSKAIYKFVKVYCLLAALLMGLMSGRYIINKILEPDVDGCWYNKDADYPDDKCTMLTILYPSTLFLILPMGVAAFNLTAAILLAAGSGFATMMALLLADSWVNRFSSLRQLDVSGGEEGEGAGEKGESKAAFAALVARDATESYLFQQAFMNFLGQKFNMILACQVLISFVILAVNIVPFVLAEDPETVVNDGIPDLIFLLGWINLTYGYPIWCIAHANLAIDRLQQSVAASGIADFSVLGGREEWGIFMRENPCFWGIFGIPFTYNTLGVALTSTIAPILYLLLPSQWATGELVNTNQED